MMPQAYPFSRAGQEHASDLARLEAEYRAIVAGETARQRCAAEIATQHAKPRRIRDKAYLGAMCVADWQAEARAIAGEFPRIGGRR